MRLFLAYVIASSVPLLLLAALLVRDSQHEAVEHGLGQGRAQAAVITQMAVAPALAGGLLSDGLSRAERERLQGATDLSVFSGSLVRLRLRSFDGAVVFSDDDTTVGGVPVSSLDFQAAATSGQVRAALQVDPVDGLGQVVRVLQPVVPSMSGRAAGVLELYLPYDEIAATSQAELSRSYQRLGLALSLLYLVLACISWSSSRSLRRHAAQREFEALHDALTGLPNREHYRGALRLALGVGQRPAPPERLPYGSVVLVDLDGFKEVNDTLGHAAGDELLQVVAQRLQEGLRTDDLVARLGGDEFALLLPEVEGEDLAVLLHQLHRRLREPYLVAGTEVRVGGSFGGAAFPQCGREADALLRRADSAMYAAKRARTGVVVAGPDDARLRAVPALVPTRPSAEERRR